MANENENFRKDDQEEMRLRFERIEREVGAGNRYKSIPRADQKDDWARWPWDEKDYLDELWP